MAVIGQLDEISRRIVSGWVADDQQWDRRIEVVILVNGQEFTRITGSIFRDEVKASLPANATGIYGFEYVFEPPLSVFEEQRIEVKPVGSTESVQGGSKLLARPKSAHPPLLPPLLPIIITSEGRSGTSLLMQRLSLLPEVVTGSLYPYELKLANYYSAAFRVLAADTDRARSTDPDTMLEDNQFRIGSNPFTRPGYYTESERAVAEKFYENVVPEAFSAMFRDLILSYYNALKESQGKTSARFFAEKSALDDVARMGCRVFFGTVREIVLLRDPRDLFCSAKAFWKMSSEQALRLAVRASRRLEKMCQNLNDDSIYMRYEDLVTDPSGTTEKIVDFIGVDRHKLVDLAREGSLFSRHGTSTTPQSSIGRWRTDLTQKEIDTCERYVESFLDRFGYERIARQISAQ